MNIYNKKEVSKKTGSDYNICVIELSNKIGEVQILDFGNEVPYSIDLDNVSVEKTEKGYYMIKELDYSIPYKYNLAINLLLKGEN